MIKYWIGLANDGKEIKAREYKRELGMFEMYKDKKTLFPIIYNVAPIMFPEAKSNWGEITHVLLMNDKTGKSKPLMAMKLIVSKHVTKQTTASFGINAIHLKAEFQ